MFGKLLSRLTYANVVSSLALFLALGGGGVALASHLRVFSSDIVDQNVRNADLATNAIGTTNIADGQVRNADIASSAITHGKIQFNSIFNWHIVDNTIKASDIKNLSLKDEDIAQGAFVDFEGNIGVVPARQCVRKTVTGINAGDDHLVLAARATTAPLELIYTAEYVSPNTDGSAFIKVCNPTNTAINDGTTRFNLLVIDAQ